MMKSNNMNQIQSRNQQLNQPQCIPVNQTMQTMQYMTTVNPINQMNFMGSIRPIGPLNLSPINLNSNNTISTISPNQNLIYHNNNFLNHPTNQASPINQASESPKRKSKFDIVDDSVEVKTQQQVSQGQG